jgi:hypothetical protein
MQRRTLTQRVEILEQKVAALETLPARVTAVELQILQLRDEMRGGFSALRQEWRQELQSAVESLRTEIRTGDEEIRRYMRVLHEDLIARIAALGDSRR